MFAKRHYESVALAMQRAHPQDHSKRLDQWHTVKRELAAMFKADSSRFDEARFVVACLPGHNVRARTQHLKVDYQGKHRFTAATVARFMPKAAS